jgi:hypothetical protein
MKTIIIIISDAFYAEAKLNCKFISASEPEGTGVDTRINRVGID